MIMISMVDKQITRIFGESGRDWTHGSGSFLHVSYLIYFVTIIIHICRKTSVLILVLYVLYILNVLYAL